MERIAAGFSLAEAPTVTADDVLLVSDVIGGGVRRFDAGGNELEPLLSGRRGIGGMGLLPDGRVLVSGRDLSAVHRDGTSETVLPLLEGGTGFNDLAVTGDGAIVAGMLTSRPMAGEPLTPAALVVRTPDGEYGAVDVAFGWPNGIGFSPAEDLVYVADFDTGIVHRGEWGGAGPLALEPWAASPSGDADGLAVDADGHVWVAAGAGGLVLHYDTAAALVEQIAVPDDFVSSCCWWPGRSRLVVTTGSGVFLHET